MDESGHGREAQGAMTFSLSLGRGLGATAAIMTRMNTASIVVILPVSLLAG